MTNEFKRLWKKPEQAGLVISLISMIFAAGVCWNRADAAIEKVAEIDGIKLTIAKTSQRVEDIAEFIGAPKNHRAIP